jgi:hypothetical protein
MHTRSLPSRLWFRGRYYLSGLILILPVMAFPAYFERVATPPLGANILPERSVGPFRVTLAEFRPGPPRIGPRKHLLKDYSLHVAEGYPDRIRSVYIRLGEPPNVRNLGEFMHGNPYRLRAHVRFMEPPRADEKIWLTIEEWDGTMHQASWPLTEAMTKVKFENPEGK